HRGIQRGEQRILDEHARAREGVQQTRLSCVRVTRDRNRRDRIALALGALRVARWREIADLPTKQCHPSADATTIELDLRLAWASRAHSRSPGADLATGLTAHRVAPTTQARKQIFELRELDLSLALTALRVLAEDVQDDGGAVDDLHLDNV